jgi:hypothetical protein
MHMLQTIPLAGDAITGRLKTLIKNHGSLITEVHAQFNNTNNTSNSTTQPPDTTIPTPERLNSTELRQPPPPPPTPNVAVPDSIIDAQPPEQWEDLKARACFVGGYPTLNDLLEENREGALTSTGSIRNRLGTTGSGEHPYTIYQSHSHGMVWRLGSSAANLIPGVDRVYVPGWVRERATEVLFEGDDDGNSVASIALDALLKVCMRLLDSFTGGFRVR